MRQPSSGPRGYTGRGGDAACCLSVRKWIHVSRSVLLSHSLRLSRTLLGVLARTGFRIPTFERPCYLPHGPAFAHLALNRSQSSWRRSGGFTPAKSFGMAPRVGGTNFLATPRARPSLTFILRNLIRCRAKLRSRRTPSLRLYLNYDIHCRVQHKTIAVVAWERPRRGTSSPAKTSNPWRLSLVPCISIQNAHSCLSPAYKLLSTSAQGFQQNIVESINVGVRGARHGDRIERLERADEGCMPTSLASSHQPLNNCLPADFGRVTRVLQTPDSTIFTIPFTHASRESAL